MNASDTLIKLALAAVLPLSLFLGGWWGSIGRMPDDRVFVAALAGLALGVAIDAVLLRKWIARPFESRGWTLVAVFLFYSVCTLGFFMGVPVFNLLPGAAAGIYAGRRLVHSRLERAGAVAAIRRVSMLASASMALICAASAYLALLNPMDTARNLQGMLGIRSFQVTAGMVIAIIAIGGTALVFVQYHVTKIAAKVAYGRTS
jgi:hypothetical protein